MLTFKNGKISPGSLELGFSSEIWQQAPWAASSHGRCDLPRPCFSSSPRFLQPLGSTCLAQAGNVLCALLYGGRDGLPVGEQNSLESGLCRNAISAGTQVRIQIPPKPLECMKARFLRFQFAGRADSLLTEQHLDNGEFEEEQNTSFLCTPGSENLTNAIELRPAIQCLPNSSTGM